MILEKFIEGIRAKPIFEPSSGSAPKQPIMAGVAVAKHSFLAALQSVIGRGNEVTLKADSESISKASEKTQELGITHPVPAVFVENETPNVLPGQDLSSHDTNEGGADIFVVPEVTRPEWGFSEAEIATGNTEEKGENERQDPPTPSNRGSGDSINSQFPTRKLIFEIVENVNLAVEADDISHKPVLNLEESGTELIPNPEIHEPADPNLSTVHATHWRVNYSNQEVDVDPSKNVTVSRSAPSVESPSALFKILDRSDEGSFPSGISKSTNEGKTRPNRSSDSWESDTGTKGLNRIDGAVEVDENRGLESNRVDRVDGFRFPSADAAVRRDQLLAKKQAVEYSNGESRSLEHSKLAVPTRGVAPVRDGLKGVTDAVLPKLIPDDLPTTQLVPSVKQVENSPRVRTNWAQPINTATKPEVTEAQIHLEQRLPDRAHLVEIKEIGPSDLPRTPEIETKLQQQPGFRVPLETVEAAVDPEGGFDRLPNSALVGSVPRVEQVAQNAVRAVLMSIQSPSVQDEGQAQASSAVSVEIDTVSDHLEIRFHADKRDTVDLLSRFQFQLEGELRRSGVENFSLSFAENRDREGRHGPERSTDIRAGANDDNNHSLAVPGRVYSDAVLDRLV